MTFKQDEKTGCWLLYQEYTEASMRHSHNLEKRKYDSVKDYVREYHAKVKSVAELKDHIYTKFGVDYTFNQISYFKGKLDASGLERELSSDNDCQNLVKLLKKNSANDGDFLEYEFDSSDKGNLQFLFYSTAKMIFVNKRFTQNRFKRPMLMFFTVSNTGKSQMLGLSLVEKEETNFFNRAVQCFLKHFNGLAPLTVIIERHLKLYNAFKELMPESAVLFCYFHI